MIKLYKNIALILLFITLLSGCQTFSKSHLTVIKEGKKPKVAIIVSTPEETIIEYVGFTVFNNSRYNHSSESLDDTIRQAVKSTLNADRIIDYSFPDASKKAALEKKMSKPLKEFWYTRFTDKELPLVSEWGRTLNVDYVAFIFPGSSPNIIYNRAGRTNGKGLLVDHAAISLTFLYASHDIHLVDVSTSQVSDIADATTFKQIKNFHRELSDEEIKEIKSEREIQEVTNTNYLLLPPLESEFAYASLFRAKDFETISDEQIKLINQQLVPIVERNIEQNLIKLGFTRQVSELGWIDQLPATDENIDPLFTQYIKE